MLRHDVVAAIALLLLPVEASADPAPGFEFDARKLEAHMDACMEYRVGPDEILMGWMNFRSGDRRHWRCSSLRHMLLDDEDRPAHTPMALWTTS